MLNKIKKQLREWGSALLFAIFVATPLRWAIAEPYVVPTSSMEGTILVGDYLLVSKFHYGARTASTILQIPLTFQKIWGTKIPSYLDWIEIPSIRLPGISEIKRNDVIVFNFPGELERPIDMRTYYVKRCIAISGDTIQLKEGQVHINHVLAEDLGNYQSAYILTTDENISKRLFSKYNITDYQKIIGGYIVHCNQDVKKALEKYNFIHSISALYASNELANHQPFLNNYGPLYIPKKGDKIKLTPENVSRYEDVLLNHESTSGITINKNSLYKDGVRQEWYSFKQNYYFMMGDNRNNSSDSRYWGFVPQSHIVGKALFTWFSKKQSDLLFDVRWERCFKSID